MRVRIRYFAVLRERLGRDDEELELAEGATVEAALRALGERHPMVARLRPHLQVAVNQRMAPVGATLADSDELALLPPVAGGAGEPPPGAPVDPRSRPPPARILDAPLELAAVVQAVGGADAGGVVTFTGVVRRHSRGRTVERLEYEAYREMAERTLARIAEEVGATHGAKVAIDHRVGVLRPGDVAVVIAASAAHRAAAFAACREAIERLKQEAPIWKKEVGADGAEWVGLGP